MFSTWGRLVCAIKLWRVPDKKIHAHFVKILFVLITWLGSEIVRILTKRKWNYFLISRVCHLITFSLGGKLRLQSMVLTCLYRKILRQTLPGQFSNFTSEAINKRWNSTHDNDITKRISAKPLPGVQLGRKRCFPRWSPVNWRPGRGLFQSWVNNATCRVVVIKTANW